MFTLAIITIGIQIRIQSFINRQEKVFYDNN